MSDESGQKNFDDLIRLPLMKSLYIPMCEVTEGAQAFIRGSVERAANLLFEEFTAHEHLIRKIS